MLRYFVFSVIMLSGVYINAQECSWERTGGYCNFDGDCCPGRYCSAFGLCERKPVCENCNQVNKLY